MYNSWYNQEPKSVIANRKGIKNNMNICFSLAIDSTLVWQKPRVSTYVGIVHTCPTSAPYWWWCVRLMSQGTYEDLVIYVVLNLMWQSGRRNPPSVVEPFRIRVLHEVSILRHLTSTFQSTFNKWRTNFELPAKKYLGTNQTVHITTMAQPQPLAKAVGAPPGFATTNFLNNLQSAATSCPAATVEMTISLNLTDVNRLAAQERWRTHHINHE